jgi:hypothetical protein
MALEHQQLFLSLVTEFFSALPVHAGRCDAAAALRLACTARSPQRHQLSCWGWRAMRQCELDAVRVLHLREQSYMEWFQLLGTLIRSNTDAVPGSLLSRLRYVISNCAVLEGIARNARSAATPRGVRSWFETQVERGRFWFGPENLAADQTVAVAGELEFTDSDDEGSEEEL